MTEQPHLTLYVYYKIAAHERDQHVLAINQLATGVKQLYPELQIHHQKRPELDEDKNELWMEIYQPIATEKMQNFMVDLAELLKKSNLPKARRQEIFQPI